MKRLFSLKAHPSSLILKESSPRTPRRVVQPVAKQSTPRESTFIHVMRRNVCVLCVRSGIYGCVCVRVYVCVCVCAYTRACVCVSPRINRAQVECLLKPILYSLAVPPTRGGFHYRSESFRPPGC